MTRIIGSVFRAIIMIVVLVTSPVVDIPCVVGSNAALSSALVAPSTAADHRAQALSYLQSESASLASSQKAIADFLVGKKIPINDKPGSLRKASKDHLHLRIAVSSEESPLDCRISLGKVAPGRKCLAPCACSGSQQWIAFAEFNKLRRKDPTQWRVCRTCQQKYDVDSLELAGSALGLVLDKKWIFRSGVASVALLAAYLIALPKLLMRFLVSKTFWNQYPQWSRIVHLPLVLKFWGGKLLLQFLGGQYLKVEKEIMQRLAEIETAIIEPNLPIIE